MKTTLLKQSDKLTKFRIFSLYSAVVLILFSLKLLMLVIRFILVMLLQNKIL